MTGDTMNYYDKHGTLIKEGDIVAREPHGTRYKATFSEKWNQLIFPRVDDPELCLNIWFDEELEKQIRRCGKNNKLFAYHICDWNVPTTDMLNDRGLMGEGCIPLKQIRGWVEEAGFSGFHEVEIFSTKFWKGDQVQFLDKIVKAYTEHS